MRKKEDLLKYDEISKVPLSQIDGVLDYMLFVYDNKSELILSYPEIRQRKQKAMNMVDVPSTLKEDLLTLNNKEFRQILDFFLKEVVNSLTFQRLISDMEVFWECQAMMRESYTEDDALDYDKKIKAMELKTGLSTKSKILEDAIMSSFDKIYTTAEDFKPKKVLSTRPEDIAINVQAHE